MLAQNEPKLAQVSQNIQKYVYIYLSKFCTEPDTFGSFWANFGSAEF